MLFRSVDLYSRLSRQQIIVSTLGDVGEIVLELKNHPSVTGWETIQEKPSLRLEFSGNMEEAAQLLRSLIEAGIPVTEFQRQQEDLETIFLKLGHQQAS